MLRVSDSTDPFLRRTFSFFRIFPPQGERKRPEDEGALEICYQVVGRGTSRMAQLRMGERLDVLGPLGKIQGIRERQRMGFEPQVATEDGSLGIQGLATDLLERELLTQGPKSVALYSCGPWPMLARVA